MNKLGKYQIIEKIGEGGFGTVYKAVDTTLDRTVALKVLKQVLLADPVFLERFHREAKAAAALQHPNIVIVYEIGEEQGEHFIAMQFVEGHSLADVLKESGTLPFDRASTILRQLADALDYAHARGILHRDIKPGNILIDDHDHITLTDFGLTRLTETSGVTTGSQILGTPTYMAPEQLNALSPKPADARTDIYALGVVMYEMLTGRPPFIGDTTAVAVAHLQTLPLAPNKFNVQIPDALSQVVLKTLAKDPDERYARASEFADAFSAAVPQLIAPKESAEAPKRETASTQRRLSLALWLAVGAGLLLVALVSTTLIVAFNFISRPHPTPISLKSTETLTIPQIATPFNLATSVPSTSATAALPIPSLMMAPSGTPTAITSTPPVPATTVSVVTSAPTKPEKRLDVRAEGGLVATDVATGVQTELASSGGTLTSAVWSSGGMKVLFAWMQKGERTVMPGTRYACGQEWASAYGLYCGSAYTLVFYQ